VNAPSLGPAPGKADTADVKRNLLGWCAAACALAVLAPASAIASPQVVARGSATGTVTVANGYSFTIQTPGPATGVVNAMTAAANGITSRDYPYVYGGGHTQAGVASVGTRRRGRRIGFDCSGSVAAVLASAGLWPAGAGVPNDAGVIAQLLREKVIARGVGTGPVEVTLYDHPGVHIFLNIDGRFFGTSDGGGGGNPRGGAGWLSDGAPDASSHAYRRYHVLPSVLRQSTNAARTVTFQGVPTQGVLVGEQVQVSYEELASGSLLATTVAYPGAVTATGTVQSVAADGSSFTFQDQSGATTTVMTPTPVDGLAVGDTVQVTYTSAGATMIALDVSVTGTGSSAG
jgi:hypothetical protein